VLLLASKVEGGLQLPWCIRETRLYVTSSGREKAHGCALINAQPGRRLRQVRLAGATEALGDQMPDSDAESYGTTSAIECHWPSRCSFCRQRLAEY